MGLLGQFEQSPVLEAIRFVRYGMKYFPSRDALVYRGKFLHLLNHIRI